MSLPDLGPCPACGCSLALGHAGPVVLGTETGIRPAGTAVVVMDAAAGLEVLLVRRASGMAFHGGAWVFPGGAVDDSDRPAVDAGGDALVEAAAAARRATARELGEEAGLTLPPEELVLLSHWTTPPAQPRRFSTWFFLAAVPAGTAVTVDGDEVVEARWSRPRDALDLHARGEIDLAPPTFVTLVELDTCGSVAEALRVAAARPAPVRALRILGPPGSGRLDGVLGAGVAVLSDDAAYVHGDLDAPGPRHRLVMDGLPWRLVDTRAAPRDASDA